VADGETQSTADGAFSFADVDPGPYHISFAAEGFALKIITGKLGAGETVRLSATTLAVASFATQVTVTPAQVDIAEAQIKIEETQRIAGLLPNFFVNYDSDAAPLNVRQKFELTWKGFVDPTAFAGVGITAAFGQARNTNPGFGPGTHGYAKRYAASYADFVTGRLIDKVVMPTIFKQDPRYFYNGKGTRRSRVLYAISRAVICRGDNKQAQPCYSGLISHLASGGLANLYLPPADRNSTRVIFENSAIGIGGNVVGNLIQEFIARRLTRKKT